MSLPGRPYDPLVVEIELTERFIPQVRVYRNGQLIAHSAVEEKGDSQT